MQVISLKVRFLTYSLIIPVLKLEGNPYLESLLQTIAKQSRLPNEVHLVIGDKRQGRAINYGASQIKDPYLGTVDDDTQIDDPDLFKKILEAIEEDESIGMAGAACEIPEQASSFQKKAMRQIERRYFPTQKVTLESDMVQHPCLIMPTSLFRDIDGEDEELVRGLDPVLRKKVRDRGKKVVIVKDTWVYHLLPNKFQALLKMYYRNGRGSGYAQKHFPEKVLELTDGKDEGAFVEKRSFGYRLFRRIIRLAHSMVTGQWIKVSTDAAYVMGVLKELTLPSYTQSAPMIDKIKSQTDNRYPYQLHYHHVTLKETPAS